MPRGSHCSARAGRHSLERVVLRVLAFKVLARVRSRLLPPKKRHWMALSGCFLKWRRERMTEAQMPEMRGCEVTHVFGALRPNWQRMLLHWFSVTTRCRPMLWNLKKALLIQSRFDYFVFCLLFRGFLNSFIGEDDANLGSTRSMGDVTLKNSKIHISTCALVHTTVVCANGIVLHFNIRISIARSLGSFATSLWPRYTWGEYKACQHHYEYSIQFWIRFAVTFWLSYFSSRAGNSWFICCAFCF